MVIIYAYMYNNFIIRRGNTGTFGRIPTFYRVHNTDDLSYNYSEGTAVFTILPAVKILLLVYLKNYAKPDLQEETPP